MPKRIPIETAKRVAREHELRQVILVAWDGARTHVVTYGQSLEDCDQAAQGGNRVKQALNWPAELIAEPSRVKKLKARIAELEAAAAKVANLTEGNPETQDASSLADDINLARSIAREVLGRGS